MSALEKHTMTPSPEAEIVRQIEDLIRKLASGAAEDGDLQRLQELQRRRVEMMRLKLHKRRVPA